MKKKYIAPDLDISKVHLEDVVLSSGADTDTYDDEDGLGIIPRI